MEKSKEKSNFYDKCKKCGLEKSKWLGDSCHACGRERAKRKKLNRKTCKNGHNIKNSYIQKNGTRRCIECENNGVFSKGGMKKHGNQRAI
jgi:hypothetical protein